MELLKSLYKPIIIFLILLLGGSFFYSQVEGFKYLDSLYFTSITVTSIGYGDFKPITDAGKIFTIFFSFLGLGVAIYLFTIIGKHIFLKHLRKDLIRSGRIKNKKRLKKIRVK